MCIVKYREESKFAGSIRIYDTSKLFFYQNFLIESILEINYSINISLKKIYNFMLYYLTIGERPNQKLIIVKPIDLTQKVNSTRL